MDVAIGLPNAVPGTTGKQLTEWARKAEERGFPALAKDEETVKGYRSAFEGVGSHELILLPCSNDPVQVDLLAEAAGL